MPEAKPNLIAIAIDKAERDFAQQLADIAGISIETANRVSIKWRMTYRAGLNDRATAIVVSDKKMLTRNAILETLKECG